MENITYDKCACCGYLTIRNGKGNFDICPICFWEDDPIQAQDELRLGANKICLKKAKMNYVNIGVSEESFMSNVRLANSNDIVNLVRYDIKNCLSHEYKEYIKLNVKDIEKRLVKPKLIKIEDKKYWIVYLTDLESPQKGYQICYSEEYQKFGITYQGKIIGIYGDLITTINDL